MIQLLEHASAFLEAYN